jgi:HSP20 family protein
VPHVAAARWYRACSFTGPDHAGPDRPIAINVESQEKRMSTDNSHSSSRQQGAERAQGSTSSQYGSGGTGQRWGEGGQGTQSPQGSQSGNYGTQGSQGQSRPAYGSAAQGEQGQQGAWGRQGTSQSRYGVQRRGGYDASQYGGGYGSGYGGGYGAGPFSLMRRISDEMDRVFESFGMGRNFLPEEMGQGRSRGALQSTASLWSPHLEVFERNGKLVIEADLPGVKRDDVNVQIEQDAVIIQGQRQQQSENNDQRGYYHSERSYGSFYRMIPLPEGVDTEQATAIFRDGVLEIEVPMPRQQQRSRQLEVRDGNMGSTQGGTSAQGSTGSSGSSASGTSGSTGSSGSSASGTSGSTGSSGSTSRSGSSSGSR